MAPIQYDVDTGWPSGLDTMNYRISALTRRWSEFKIGITNNPERRWREEYEGQYDEMTVVYETSSRRNAATLETWLIDYYKAHSSLAEKLNNDRRGGGGPKGEGWYYVYVVRRS